MRMIQTFALLLLGGVFATGFQKHAVQHGELDPQAEWYSKGDCQASFQSLQTKIEIDEEMTPGEMQENLCNACVGATVSTWFTSCKYCPTTNKCHKAGIFSGSTCPGGSFLKNKKQCTTVPEKTKAALENKYTLEKTKGSYIDSFKVLPNKKGKGVAKKYKPSTPLTCNLEPGFTCTECIQNSYKGKKCVYVMDNRGASFCLSHKQEKKKINEIKGILFVTGEGEPLPNDLKLHVTDSNFVGYSKAKERDRCPLCLKEANLLKDFYAYSESAISMGGQAMPHFEHLQTTPIGDKNELSSSSYIMGYGNDYIQCYEPSLELVMVKGREDPLDCQCELDVLAMNTALFDKQNKLLGWDASDEAKRKCRNVEFEDMKIIKKTAVNQMVSKYMKKKKRSGDDESAEEEMSKLSFKYMCRDTSPATPLTMFLDVTLFQEDFAGNFCERFIYCYVKFVDKKVLDEAETVVSKWIELRRYVPILTRIDSTFGTPGDVVVDIEQKDYPQYGSEYSKSDKSPGKQFQVKESSIEEKKEGEEKTVTVKTISIEKIGAVFCTANELNSLAARVLTVANSKMTTGKEFSCENADYIFPDRLHTIVSLEDMEALVRVTKACRNKIEHNKLPPLIYTMYYAPQNFEKMDKWNKIISYIYKTNNLKEMMLTASELRKIIQNVGSNRNRNQIRDSRTEATLTLSWLGNIDMEEARHNLRSIQDILTRALVSEAEQNPKYFQETFEKIQKEKKNADEKSMENFCKFLPFIKGGHQKSDEIDINQMLSLFLQKPTCVKDEHDKVIECFPCKDLSHDDSDKGSIKGDLDSSSSSYFLKRAASMSRTSSYYHQFLDDMSSVESNGSKLHSSVASHDVLSRTSSNH